MATKFEDVERRALDLDSPARARLAARLLESLEGGEDAGVDRAWILEAERRISEIEHGGVALRPVESVLAAARRRMSRKGPGKGRPSRRRSGSIR